MGNIHLLSTDNEQHSIVRKNTGLLLIQTPRKEYSGTKLNIYITSDEEIKEGDWRCDIELNRIEKGKETGTFKNWKKIILTTDQDLITDGVQGIDDEFLEWFVNNPSCENVVIGLEHYFDKNIDKPPFFPLRYKIIIPQEEPKQELLPDFKITKNIFDFVTNLSDTKKEEVKTMFQETLEDVIYKIFKSKNYSNLESNPNAIGFMIAGAQEGAKWQQERMYSEEEVKSFLDRYRSQFRMDKNIDIKQSDFIQWFEKFKKK